MVNPRYVIYNASLLLASALSGAGCGQPGGPPPGAPQDTAAPTIELGSESGSKDPAAGSTDSTPAAGSPSGEKGEQK